MGKAGEFSLATWHRAAVDEQLGSIAKGVLDRIGVKVLVDKVAPIVTSAAGDRPHRPIVLHPTRLIDVVNQEIADGTATEPQEAMKVLDLMHQIAKVGVVSRCRRRTGRPSHAIGTKHG